MPSASQNPGRVAALERIPAVLVLVDHAWIGPQFINFDGPVE